MTSEGVFLLCKPDLFLRAMLPQFLAYLEDNQFFVKKYLIGKVSDLHFRLMYTTHFRSDVDDWHHNRKIYEFGPALGLLVENRTLEASSFSHSGNFAWKQSDEEHFNTNFNSSASTLQKLGELKGSALPKERNPNSIRYLFQSKSRLFNLIHIADNLEQSEKEAFNWFGSQECVNQSQPGSSSGEILAEVDKHGYFMIGSLDPEYTFIKAKIRLFHAIQKKHIFEEHIYAHLGALKQFYANWAEEILASPICNGIEGTIFLSHYEKEKELLLALRREITSPKSILNTIDFLSQLGQQATFSVNFFWILEEWCVFVSSLEHYLIASRLKYN